jgi:multicomponent Na+:H+ antiporter subunit F
VTDFINLSTNTALIVCMLLIAPCAYRFFAGPTVVDRLLAVDTIGTLLIGIIVLLTLVRNDSLFFDVSIALAVFAFVGTLAAARYIAEGRDR